MEEPAELVFGDSNAGVGDLDAHFGRGRRAGEGVGGDADGDVAVVRELDGVAEEVEKDLTHPVGIAGEVGTGGGMDGKCEEQSLEFGLRVEEFDALGGGFGEVVRDGFEADASGLDAE